MNRLLLPVLGLVAMTGLGCQVMVPQAEYDALQRDKRSALERLARAQEEKEGLQAVIIDQQKQIHTLQALGQKRLEQLYHVDRTELGRYTGGVDTDGQSGDDAVKVFLRPVDQHGSDLKAAGSVKVQLFDLAAPQEQNLLGEYAWDVDQLAKQWSGGFMSYHYGLVCPWKSAPPKHEELTVRVEFTDYLTGKTFTAQTTCKVKLPPATQPAGS